MKTMKRLNLIVAMCLLLTFVLTACGDSTKPPATDGSSASNEIESPSEATEPETSGYVPGDYNAENSNAQAATEGGTASGTLDRLIIAGNSDAGTFDLISHASFNTPVKEYIYQNLFGSDLDQNLCPSVGKSIEQIDEMKYMVELYDNVYDSDGNKITASDVVFCYQYQLDNGKQDKVSRFDHWEIVDDTHLIFYVNGDSGDFLPGQFNSQFGIPIFSEKAFNEHDFATDPCGTGPYVLKEYNVASNVIIEFNEDWWMLDVDSSERTAVYNQCNMKEIEIKILQDDSSRSIALEMGNVDIADSLAQQDIDYFETFEDMQTVDLPSIWAHNIYFNCSDSSLTGDVNLRKAICYAIDSNKVAEGLDVPSRVCYGIAPFLYDGLEKWSDPSTEYYSFNEETAKELMSEAGYNGETLRLVYVSDTTTDAIVIMLQSQLRNIGINIELMSLERSVIDTYLNDKTAWDISINKNMGGSYVYAPFRQWTSENNAGKLPDGMTISMIADPVHDELFFEMRDSQEEAAMEAWDDYFSYEKCYAYAIVCCGSQTTAKNYLNVVVNQQGKLLPGSFTWVTE